MVVDASALGEILRGSPQGHAVAVRLRGKPLAAPELVDAEVLSALRRVASAGVMTEDRAAAAVRALIGAPIRRYRHRPLVRRAWELRGQVTPYDALYVTLAEALGVPLVTCDGRLARAEGHGAEILLVEAPR